MADRRQRPGLVTPATTKNASSTTGSPKGSSGVGRAGALGRYAAGRERVLGRRVVLSLADPAEAAQELAEALGGRQVAARLLHDLLDTLEPGHEVWEHPDDCPLCGTWRQRLAAVTA